MWPLILNKLKNSGHSKLFFHINVFRQEQVFVFLFQVCTIYLVCPGITGLHKYVIVCVSPFLCKLTMFNDPCRALCPGAHHTPATCYLHSRGGPPQKFEIKINPKMYRVSKKNGISKNNCFHSISL